jgi:hypothetical protein
MSDSEYINDSADGDEISKCEDMSKNNSALGKHFLM